MAVKKQWFYSVHMGWWNDEEEPFSEQMDRLQEHVGQKNRKCILNGEILTVMPAFPVRVMIIQRTLDGTIPMNWQGRRMRGSLCRGRLMAGKK